MAWYRVGVCNLINGSAAVAGVGTAWATNAQPGDQLRGPDYSTYEIGSVNSDLSITLAEPYRGTTAAGQAYAIAPTQGRVRDLAAQVLALINSYGAVLTGAGAGLFQDGTVSTPGMSFASDPDCGWYRIGANNIGLATGGVLRVNCDASGLVAVGGAPNAGLFPGVVASLQALSTSIPAGIAAYQADGTKNLRIGMFADAAAGYVGWDMSYSTGMLGYAWKIINVVKMLLDTNGNLGIGVASPGAKLHVVDYASGVGSATIRAQGAGGGYGAGLEAGSALSTSGTYKSMGKIVWDGDAAWDSASAATQNSRISIWTTYQGVTAARVFVDTAGNVGINNPSPGNLGKFAVGDTNGTMFWAAPTAGFGDLGMVGGPGNVMRVGPANYASGGTALMYTNAAGLRKEALRADGSGFIFQTLQATVPSMPGNSTMAFRLESETQVRMYVQTASGNTRTVLFTIA